MLTLDDVQRAFPGAKPDRLDGDHASSCGWSYPNGHLSIVIDAASPQPVRDAIAPYAREFLDPFKRNAAANVRYESLRGVGDEALAVIEPADVTRGVVDDAAFAIIRRGTQQAVVVSVALAGRDRGEALRVLGQLGAAVAARME